MKNLTLVEQCLRDQAKVPGATGELSTILSRISLAGRMIATEIMRAGFVGKLGLTGDVNVQDEEVRALDVISDDIFKQVFANLDVLAAVASEEMERVHHFHGGGKYVLMVDPLDGSGNVDVDGPMGSIFSVLMRKSSGGKATAEDFFQPGAHQAAAGYILYGPSTMFVYTAGGPVNGFTLDRAIGAFFLTHPDMRIPEGKGAYSVNEANQPKWDENTRAMVERFRTGGAECGVRSARYIGALVADVHRLLIQGGIYMYPGEVKRPSGKLRLLYECAPLAFVARQAGGIATDGKQDLLDITPTELHQRTPIFIGARPAVEEAMREMR